MCTSCPSALHRDECNSESLTVFVKRGAFLYPRSGGCASGTDSCVMSYLRRCDWSRKFEFQVLNVKAVNTPVITETFTHHGSGESSEISISLCMGE